MKIDILLILLFGIIIIYQCLFINIERFSNFHEQKRKDKKIGIIIIATNSYFLLGLRFVKQWMHYFNSNIGCKFYFFSDKNIKNYLPHNFKQFVHHIPTNHNNWEDATNSKFQNIINIKKQLKKDNITDIFYFDADTTIKKPFDHKWFLLGDLVGGQHYNDYNKEKPYDRNPKSKAYIPKDTKLKQTYFYGAFFGGKVNKVMDFCKKLIKNQKQDKLINYEPIWNDESYINNYFHYHRPHIVYNKIFSSYFNISDKNGLTGDNKNTKNNWNKYYLKSLKQDKDCVFNQINIKEKKYNCTNSLQE